LNKSILNKSLFFIIWIFNPFISAIILFGKSKWSGNVIPFLLLSFFFGISFTLPNGSNADALRYAAELHLANSKYEPIDLFLSDVYKEESTKIDVYQPVVTWIVSRFTNNDKWLFGVFSLVFGFFWFGSIRLLRLLLPSKLDTTMTLIFLLFALSNPIWSINGVRMWTAVSAFFYGLLRLHYLEDRNGLVFLILSIFVHFSLVICLVLYVFCLVLLKGNLTLIYFTYLLSLLIRELDLELFRNYFEFLPAFTQTRKGYLDDEYRLEINDAAQMRSFHIQLYIQITKYLIIAMSSWLYFSMKTRKLATKSKISEFFIITLIYATFANFASQVPSGGRFMTLSNLLTIFTFVWYVSKFSLNYTFHKYRLLTIPMLFIVVINQIRIGLDHVGFFFFIGNPFVNVFIHDEVPIIEFIKSLN
jgi:hypothetical protein